MQSALISLLNGVTYGLLLFTLSSGLTLIFSMMGILNFAHASLYMLGAYFAFQISTYVGFWPGLVIAPLLVGVFGGVVERYGIRRAHRYGHVAELLFTFGLAFLIEEGVKLVWGKATVDYRIPSALEGSLFTVFGTSFPRYKGFMMLVSLAMLAGLYALLTRSRIGLIVRASLSRPDMVEALGHNVPRIFTWTFGVGAAMAGLAGVIGGNAFVTEPGMAAAVGPIVFVIVVVGGLGSVTGAFAASLFLGVVQTWMVSIDYSVLDVARTVGIALEPGTALTRLSVTQIAPIMPYMLMVAMLVARPRGLMGARET